MQGVLLIFGTGNPNLDAPEHSSSIYTDLCHINTGKELHNLEHKK